MWTIENRPHYDRDRLRYPSDLTAELRAPPQRLFPQVRLRASTAMSSDWGSPAAWAFTEERIAATVSSTE